MITTSLVLVAALAQSAVQGVWPRVPPAVFVDLPYPAEALAARVEGVVVLRVATDRTGRVTSAESLSGPDPLVLPALANVRQWTLSPGLEGGVVVFRFEIDQAFCNDDSRSLFRLMSPNLALVTACSTLGRVPASAPPDDFYLISTGESAEYPPIAVSARLTGVVVLELSVDAKGDIADIRSLTELPLLTEAAVAHAKQWRTRPGGRRSGLIVYEFALDRRTCTAAAPTEFWRVTSNYWRLSACSPFINAEADRIGR